MKVDGIPGSSKVQGREDQLEILGFNHQLHIPTDPKNGTAAGTRVHGMFTVLKNFDKSSPKLYDYLCNGKVISAIELSWYEIAEDGKETIYFVHKLEKARVTKVRAWMPNVDDPATERYKHMEEVSLQYEKITWTFKDGNIEASNSWLEDR
jgi:type VI secretion system secreted protein Hcp